jgi:hypothetical protein
MANALSNIAEVGKIIARETLAIVDNNLSGVIDSFYRDPEAEFNTNVNGYKKGDTVSYQRPADFTVRTTETRAAQDIVEGHVSFTVDQTYGVDFDLTSKEMNLKMDNRDGIKGLRRRVIEPAAINLVNAVVADCLTEFYRGVYNWVGTPGTRITTFAGFARGPERLDEMAVPMDNRFALLNPNDNWGLVGSQTALFIQDAAKSAYRKGSLGELGGVDTYMTQTLPTHTVGPLGGTPLVNGASQNVTYVTAKDTWAQNLITDGWTAAAANRLKKGDVFTIANVFMVNPKTKANTGILQQFVVNADVSSDGSGNLTASISPPIIISGPHQTVNAAPADNAAITVLGTANTGYRQNLMYARTAFALCVVPMVIPPGSVDHQRETHNGLSIKVGPVYNGTDNSSGWRMDMLWGRKLLDPRLATRVSG